ncbi:hypothetical protein DPMN_149793 [Dreissena polymorpha]|uniref:Uncharacterized protein n=1 Tax=Dreissena polymorpha TaxID=45954 RepID=A0A9D4FCF5_DREPO|nr:hypothetical protein DPMN_149793 [Dreissena polymorpha]
MWGPLPSEVIYSLCGDPFSLKLLTPNVWGYLPSEVTYSLFGDPLPVKLLTPCLGTPSQ